MNVWTFLTGTSTTSFFFILTCAIFNLKWQVLHKKHHHANISAHVFQNPVNHDKFSVSQVIFYSSFHRWPSVTLTTKLLQAKIFQFEI